MNRAPPGISILDYLQRLATHATLAPPILLSMVYYIDRLCAFYPAFVISSLTVHRFLIASATVASKGLSDAFWTNATYARVGGISLRELALLEMEFLVRVQWRIVPKPEVLVDYYRSLVERSDGYVIDGSIIPTLPSPAIAIATATGTASKIPSPSPASPSLPLSSSSSSSSRRSDRDRDRDKRDQAVGGGGTVTARSGGGGGSSNTSNDGDARKKRTIDDK